MISFEYLTVSEGKYVPFSFWEVHDRLEEL